MLQENQIRPVGAAESVPINVRIISATHRDLHELMVGGNFREDLYYRLNVVHIEMPALGRRREDIPLLVAHFLEQIAKESGQRKIYAPEAVELLATAEWPGNVRQLYNVVRQNVALSHGAIITAELVQQSLGGNPTRLPSFDEARDEFTRNYLSQILQITGGNVSQAARLAKRNRTDFYKLLSRHQLLPDDFKRPEGCCRRANALRVELGDRRNDMRHLRLLQFRIDRQCQGFQSGLLGLRKVSGAVAQVGKALLQMQGHGVVDLAADAALGEPLAFRASRRCARTTY